MDLSVIVPCYKQEKTIKSDLKNILSVLEKTRFSFELIAIVDGFLDKTYQQAKSIKHPNLRVHGYKTNKGKGYAVRSGMARAKGNFVAFIDSGMELDPNGLSMLIEHLIWYEADIMIGSKRHPASKVAYPCQRKIISFCAQMFVRIFLNLNVRDTQVGLKVFRREVLEKVLPRIIIKRYAFDMEVLAVAKYLGFNRIFEAPIKLTYMSDQLTHAVGFGVIYNTFVDALGIVYRMRFLRYYDDRSKRKWIYDKELEMRVNV